MKVLYMTTVPAPYKCALFEELGKLCDLTVTFELDHVSYRDDSWMVSEFKNYKAIFLKGKVVKDKLISGGAKTIIRKGQFDIIIIGVYSTITQMLTQQWLIKKHIPYFLSSDGGLIKNEKRWLKALKMHFVSNASAWLSTGDITSKYLSYYGARLENTYVYPFSSISAANVINEPVSEQDKKVLKQKLNIKEKFMFLAVGQFIRRKGYDILMKAIAEINGDVGVYIVGGKATDEYTELKNKLALNNVHFLDFMDHTRLAEYYKAADVFVHPTREDIWGLVINEAMAYGLPVITTDKCVAGIEMVKEDNGDIVPTENISELKTSLQKWVDEEKEKRKKASIVSLRTAREYTIERSAKTHIDIFNKIRKKSER